VKGFLTSQSVGTALLGAFVGTNLLFGQSTFGSFVGTVHDPSGGVIPGCVITLTNTGTAAERSVATNREGNYVLVNIDPGTYQIVMKAPGFQLLTLKDLVLTARQTVRADGALAVAGQAQTVAVEATAESAISTEVSNIAETKSGRELVDLPVAIASRALGSTSAISTLTTQPGVQTDQSGNLSVAGTKTSQLSITIDGISTMNVSSAAPISELFPSFGAIEEIRVSEIDNAAEFGGVADITTISKSGTNSLHGAVYDNLQNTDMNARNPFSATVTQVKMNDFGAYLGGPVVIPHLYHGKDKTFFFMSYEGLQLPRQQFIEESVPSLALRSGDLSVYGLGQVPASLISPVALAVLKYLYPLPNIGPANAVANNYGANFPTPISSNQADLRLDQNINSKQTFFVRGTYKFKNVINTPSISYGSGIGTVLAGGLQQPEMDYSFTAAHNYIIGPTLVNELRVGVTADRTITSDSANAGLLASEIGVPLPQAPTGNNTPCFIITGFESTCSTSSQLYRSDAKQLIDNLTWTKGSHTFKFGADIRRLEAYFSNPAWAFGTSGGVNGGYTFNGSVSGLNPYLAFLEGIPDSTAVTTINEPDSNSSAVHYGLFAQDDWKVTPHLTINYGIRWEYHPPFDDKLHNMAVFIPDVYSEINGVTVHGEVAVNNDTPVNPLFVASIAPTPVLTANQAGLPDTLHYTDLTSFAPRIGFAWRPFKDDKTVIRGGYGKYIEAMLGTLTGAGWGVPTSYVGVFTNTIVNGTPTLTLAHPFPSNLAEPGTESFELSGEIHYSDPYVQQWNLTIERDLGFNTGIRISYDGNHGSNLGYDENLDQVAPNTVGFAQAASGAPYPAWSYISQDTTGARSNYEAFTVSVNKRLSHGLQFSTSYTFAKDLSNGEGSAPSSFSSQGGGTVSDIYNINLDYGNVSFVHRQRLLSTFLYELPFGRGGMFLSKANGFVNAIIGGWQLSGVMMFQTGPFLTVVAPGADPAGNNSENTQGPGRADINPGVPLYPTNQGVADWINPAAFVSPGNNIGRIGDSPVGAVVGPGTQAVSLSIFKSFPIKERVRFQFGVAASNALNHPNYAPPSNLSVGTAGFSSLTNVQSQEGAGPRSIQATGRLTF
jgi:Carboxypeptidase regulatory-like domain/TonB dependent receptor